MVRRDPHGLCRESVDRANEMGAGDELMWLRLRARGRGPRRASSVSKSGAALHRTPIRAPGSAKFAAPAPVWCRMQFGATREQNLGKLTPVNAMPATSNHYNKWSRLQSRLERP